MYSVQSHELTSNRTSATVIHSFFVLALLQCPLFGSTDAVLYAQKLSASCAVALPSTRAVPSLGGFHDTSPVQLQTPLPYCLPDGRHSCSLRIVSLSMRLTESVKCASPQCVEDALLIGQLWALQTVAGKLILQVYRHRTAVHSSARSIQCNTPAAASTCGSVLLWFLRQVSANQF